MKPILILAILTAAGATAANAASHSEAPTIATEIVSPNDPTPAAQGDRPTGTFETEMVQLSLRGD